MLHFTSFQPLIAHYLGASDWGNSMRTHIINATVSLAISISVLFGFVNYWGSLSGDEDVGPTRLALALPVLGFAEIEVSPDRATARLGMINDAETAASAIVTNNRTMQAVLDHLETAGISSENILTKNFTVGPRYSEVTRSHPQRELLGYRAQNEVEVIFEDLEIIGTTLDGAFDAGANNFINLRFWSTDQYALESQARGLAIEDAFHQAELIAEASNLELGQLVGMNTGAGNSRATQINEDAFVITGSRIARSDATSNAPSTGTAAVTSGNQKISATVTLTFQLLGPWEEEGQ